MDKKKSPSIEDRFAINDLFVRYMRAIDDGDVDTLANCFTEDGALASPAVGEYKGRKGIRDFAQRFAKFRQNGYQLRHVISNMEMKVDGDRATAFCYLVSFMTYQKKTQLLSPGYYDCKLRKVDGEWLFEHRLVVQEADYTLPGISIPMPAQAVKESVDYDVVVVGGGNAGLSAAIEAANRGAKVCLIEKGPRETRGGNSRFTYGDFRVITTGTKPILDLLDECPFPRESVEIEELTADFFTGEAMRLSEGLGDRKLTELFVSKSYESVVWMKQQGIRWTLNPVLAFKKEGKNFFPNGNANIMAIGAGPGLVEMMYGIAEKRGVDCRYDFAACKLLLAADGRVSGVLTRERGALVQVNAKAGVILCCGGFQASAEKRRRYLGENMDLVLLRGSKNNTGDWIEMTADVNAQLVGHWGGCHASSVSQDKSMVMGAHVTAQRYSFPYGIMVNRRGERFVDEGENFYCWTYNRHGKDILRQPGQIAWQIYDERSWGEVTYQNAKKVEANTLEELAQQAGIDPDGFVRTVQEFNAAIVNDEKSYVPYELDGRHTQGLKVNKSNWAQKIDSPPYRAFAVICGLTMTYGGVKVDELARVIDTSDRPIPGLYAVGELTGGYFYHTYLGGSGLIRGVVMGRIAAEDAVAKH